jgi:HAD superfamily hydrolase (TIGR01459 family)
MAEMGIPRALYDEVISSGEATWQALVDRDTETLGTLGPRCCHMGPPRDRSMLEGIPYEGTDDVAAADFILATGLDWDEDNLDPYEARLETAAARGLPLICANPDLVVIRGGKRVLCAGAIAERYEALGGKVVYIGKPYPAIYRLCLARLGMTGRGMTDRKRVVAIGDALRTDIAGAEAAGIDAVLVTGGVHAEELGIAHGDHPDMAQVERLCRAAGVMPTAAIPAFRW